jgi:hypothetical protein
MTGDTLREALAFAARGWPVLPCLPGQKIPATAHGYRDATTGERQITVWFASHPDWNLAIATGAPGPDVLDVDDHGPRRERVRRVRPAVQGRPAGRRGQIRAHPSGGLHAYFTGSAQRNGHLPAHHLDFRSRGGYVLAPPSRVDGKPPRRTQPGLAHGGDLGHLTRWVASQAEGNRNAGLFWAANRALDADPAADLSSLGAAARQAGLGDREITRTLDSARNGGRTRAYAPDYQPEAGDQA